MIFLSWHMTKSIPSQGTVLVFEKRQLQMGNFLAVFMPVVLSTLKSNSKACSVVRVGG